MRTTCKPWAGLASIIVSTSLLTGGAANGASERVSVPPEPATGDLQLVFGEGVDSKNLQAIVEETWAKSKALRAQALAGREAKDVAKIKSPDNCMAALTEKKWLPEANAFIRAFVTDSSAKKPYADCSTAWYCYFGPGGKFADRLEPQTIGLLKETMWRFANSWLSPQEGKPYEMLPLD